MYLLPSVLQTASSSTRGNEAATCSGERASYFARSTRALAKAKVASSLARPLQTELAHLRLPALSRRGSSKRRLTSESPATIKARACDERGRLASHSTSGTNSGTGDSRVSRKLVNFRTLTWQSSQGGESKDGSDNPPTF